MAPILESKKLKYIFNELCKGNISIIDMPNRIYLSDISYRLYELREVENSPEYVESLKYLIMICNVLYNRSDMLVLPVEDGLYDILLERYKRNDPNFQIGSAVVQFQSMVEKDLTREGKEVAKRPIRFVDNRKKDEIRSDFERQIKSFYNSNVFNFNDIFYERNDSHDIELIKKRKHNTEHNHPDLVGSLDKCKFVLDADAIEKDVFDDPSVKILERDFFIDHIRKGIIREDEEIEMVLELKYDGISVEADCTDEVISARTRGDTGIGEAADITPILSGYKFTRNNVIPDREVGVKFEAIMTKADLAKFNIARNYNYANCRSAIVGLFGASDAQLYRDYITLVPLALDRNDVPEIRTREEEIEFLNRVYKTKGQGLNHCYIKGNYRTCLYLIKKYVEEAMVAREYIDFLIDGVVVGYTDEYIRRILGRENYINKYQMAVKFDPDSKLTTFLGYTFTVGQNGAITPMIHYSPVEFRGTIHPKSTGSSFDRFNKLGLKIGDVIEVTYRNDVMPYVTTVDCEQNRQNPRPLEQFPTVCPECGTSLVFTTKSAICPNVDCNGRKVSRMVNMLQKLNLKGFAESTISQLGVYSFTDLFNLTIDQLNILGPTNATNFRLALDELANNPVDDYRLIGSLGFTNVAAKTWKLIFSKYTLKEFVNSMEFEKPYLFTDLCKLNGIGETTANTIINEYDFYKKDIELFLERFNIVDSKNSVKLGAKQIRFTGCRNKELEERLRYMGHDADGSASVTKKTDILIIPYDGFNSTKTAKVNQETIIVSINEFIQNMDKYLM